MRWVCGLLFGLLGMASVARADGTDDVLGPREIAVGEALRAGATGASAIGLNPSGLPLNRELVFEGGYGYRASDSASLIGVSACDSTNLMPGCFFYSYAGASPELDGMEGTRRTHLAGMSISRQFVPRVMVGATTKYYDFDSSMTSDTDASGFAFDLGATVRLTNMINVGFAAQNLWASEESAHFPRSLGGGILARPLPSVGLSFDARWKLEGESSARYGGGFEWFFRPGRGTGFPIRVGGLRDNALGASYVTGGIGMASMKWSLDVGARHQLKNGDETLILASMRFYGPRLATPSLDAEPGPGF